MNKIKDYSDKLEKILISPGAYPRIKTVEDFFDYISLKKEYRSDFIFAAILRRIDRKKISWMLLNKEEEDYKEYEKVVGKYGFHKKRQ